MNINELQPRVFHNGKLSKIDKIIFENDGILREGIGFFEEGEYGCKHHIYLYFDTDNFEIDRPVGMIKDIHGKRVMLYEDDILRVHTYENHKIANHLPDSLIIWGGDLLLRFDAIADGDDMDIDEHSNLSYYLGNDDIFGLEIIGNVHENPDLAPEWWRHKNANS